MKIPNICAGWQQYYNHLVVAEGKREDKRGKARGGGGVQREVGSGEEGSEVGIEVWRKGKDREREGRKGIKILYIAVHRVYQFVLAIAENSLAKYTAL